MIEKTIKGIKYLLDEENLTAEVLQKKGYEGDFIIPETVVFKKVTYRVTSIGREAFRDCSSLTSIVIPESVTSIGEYAFKECSSLTSIVIPDSVTSIGDSAFSDCSSLTSIVIPDGVTSIGEIAFGGCSSLTSMVVAEGNTVYDSREQCNAIIHTATNTLVRGCQSTIIPDSVMSIGREAFYGCSSLTSMVIPDSVTTIGDWAFGGCSSLTSIVIPDGVTSIGKWAFRFCSSLKQDPTQEIEMSNFKYRLLMHNHLAMVLGYSGRSATINIPSEINHEGVIYRVTSIGEYAFDHCKSLTSIVIPDGVTSIGSSAFMWCYSLTSIVIPASVTSIGAEAFWFCESLTSITFNGTKAQWKGIKLGNLKSSDVPTEVIHCTDGDVKI